MDSKIKPLVLVITDFYLPGYKSGGGLRTLVNTIDRLCDFYEFKIICRDHDGKTDRTQYKNVKINDWNQIDAAQVYFLSKENIKLVYLEKLINEVNPAIIYANSCFSTLTIFLLLLKKLRKIKKIPIIIAPEGELSEGAFNIKKTKKNIYTKFAKAISLYNSLIWKAAGEEEVQEIKKYKGKSGRVFLAPNMPPKTILPQYNQSKKIKKKSGELKMVYLSRIHPKKNLKFLLELILKSGVVLELDIYGPNDSPEYFQECLEIIESPLNKSKVRIMGEISHNQVAETLYKYHIFCLPTLSENFGHVMPEAFAAGCPVLISDQTPWRNLEAKNIGWDIDLKNQEKWLEILKYCISLDGVSYCKLSENSRDFATNWLNNQEIEKATKKVFDFALEQTLR